MRRCEEEFEFNLIIKHVQPIMHINYILDVQELLSNNVCLTVNTHTSEAIKVDDVSSYFFKFGLNH